MSRYEAVSTYSMSLRPDHSTVNAPIDSIPAQSRIHGDVIWEDVGEKWLKVTDVNNQAYPVAAQGWVAIIHASRVYCALTEINPPVTETLPPRVGLTFDGTTIKWYVAE